MVVLTVQETKYSIVQFDYWRVEVNPKEEFKRKNIQSKTKNVIRDKNMKLNFYLRMNFLSSGDFYIAVLAVY